MRHSDYCRQFIPEGGAVLDVGSGRGEFLVEMALGGFQAYGVEPSAEYIQRAQAAAKERGARISLVYGGGERLPFPDGFFDFVNCAEVTEHTENPEQVCRQIWRVLKAGGRCYISFHNRFGIYDYHYRLWGINWMPRPWADSLVSLFGMQKEDSPQIGRQGIASMHYYTFAQAIALLSASGFSVYPPTLCGMPCACARDSGFSFVSQGVMPCQGGGVSDIREEKIQSRYGWYALPMLLLYRLLLRPLYFNTFHLLLKKV